jgi:hypothetical protein
MLRFLFRLFVTTFYRQHTGFFLFFFFIFFGVVNANSLVAYHRSLMDSSLRSPVILAGFCAAWLLYHLKATAWCRRLINSNEGNFLYLLQMLPREKQLTLYATVQTALYAPVLLYAAVLAAYGFHEGYEGSAVAVILFQVLILVLGTATLYRRLHSWLVPHRSLIPDLRWNRPKPFGLYILYHFSTTRRTLLLSLKAVSLALLYIVLVWNRDRYDNDSFVFFFLLILLLHTATAFEAVRFMEGGLAGWRNLPLSLARRATVYVLSYAVLLLPELAYGLWQGVNRVPLPVIGAYYGIAVASLFFLTAVQYSERMNAGEYVKVVFALAFVSIFALHAQAFLFWLGSLAVMGVLLFWNGFYKYEA